MQSLVKDTPQKPAQKTVSSYLTVMDGDKQKLYSLKDFSTQYNSYKDFDEKYTKTIYRASPLKAEGRRQRAEGLNSLTQMVII